MCGITIFTYGVDLTPPHTQFTATELPSEETPRFVADWLQNPGHWFIAVQGYTIAHGGVKTPQYEALYTIGALRYVASQCNATFEIQNRSEARRVGPDETLKKLGWYTKTKDGHANDSTRHVILTLTRHHPVELAALLDLVD